MHKKNSWNESSDARVVLCKCEDALASGSVVGIVNITSSLELSEALYL